jgi:hypothetical protein
MIRYYSPTEINRDRWDKLIAASLNSLPYACTWYLDAIHGDQWGALIEDDYTFVMPIPEKSKWAIAYLSTPLFIQQLGIFSEVPVEESKAQSFLNELKTKFSYIDFNMNYGNPIESDALFTTNQRTNLILTIPDDRTLIRNSFSENTLRNIQKAEKLKLYYGTCSVRSVINLFSENKAATLPNWNGKNYIVLERLFHMASLRGFARSMGMYSQRHELLCGAIFIEWNGRSIFLFSGNSEEGKGSGAMAYLIYQYILDAPAGTSVFDFEGSDNPGLKRFYESFGAIEQNYIHLKHNSLPFYMRWLKS